MMLASFGIMFTSFYIILTSCLHHCRIMLGQFGRQLRIDLESFLLHVRINVRSCWHKCRIYFCHNCMIILIVLVEFSFFISHISYFLFFICTFPPLAVITLFIHAWRILVTESVLISSVQSVVVVVLPLSVRPAVVHRRPSVVVTIILFVNRSNYEDV